MSSFHLYRLELTQSCGLAWTQGIMRYKGVQIPHEKGQFWWIGAPIVNYRHFLPWAVQERLNWSIRLGCGLQWAAGCTSSIVFARWCQCALMGGHIAATWRIRFNHSSTAAIRLMSNYF